jgi:hypothetical protein
MTECCISVTGINVWTFMITVEVHSVVCALSALYLAMCTHTQMSCNIYFNPYPSASAVLYIPLKPRGIAPRITAFCIVSVTVSSYGEQKNCDQQPWHSAYSCSVMSPYWKGFVTNNMLLKCLFLELSELFHWWLLCSYACSLWLLMLTSFNLYYIAFEVLEIKKNIETWCLVVCNYMELSCYSPTDLQLKMFSHIMHLN